MAIPNIIQKQGTFDTFALQKYFANHRIEWTQQSIKDLRLMELSGLFKKTQNPHEYKLVVMESWFHAYIKNGVDILKESESVFFPARSETRYLCVFIVDAILCELATELRDVLGSDIVCKLQIVLPLFARFKLQKMALEDAVRTKANRQNVKRSRILQVMKDKEGEIMVNFGAAFHEIGNGLKKLRSLKAIGQQHAFCRHTYKECVNTNLKRVAQTLSVCCLPVCKLMSLLFV